MCQNERRTMFAPHTNTLLFEQRNKQFGSDFWILDMSIASFHTCIYSFSKVFNDFVDGKLSQITRSACLSLVTDFSFSE